ncbi:MAG TPA: carboxypeptidase M32, partial [Halococcus sp.]|nr:carboxypeptidase M32 [Halococcus sp.]
MATDASTETYDELTDRYERITNIQGAAGILNWDQEVMMPEGGTPARSAQLSALSAVSHELLTEDEMGEALDAAESADLGEKETAVVREIRRQYERSARVPTELVEEISRTTSEALPVWKEARAEDDFSKFAPILEDLIDLKCEYADAIDSSRPPYEVLFEDYEPYLGLDTAERILERLREELVPLIEAVGESDVELARPFEGTFDADTQEALTRDALDTLGYDWNRGRLDTAPHPFSMGTTFDARVTTRYDEEDLLGALTSTIHEFGHATYTLGLPDEAYGTPLGENRNLSVHESQSRLWENHVARSQPFWSLFLPTVKDRFSGLADVTARDAYEAANRVYDDNLIRV